MTTEACPVELDLRATGGFVERQDRAHPCSIGQRGGRSYPFRARLIWILVGFGHDLGSWLMSCRDGWCPSRSWDQRAEELLTDVLATPLFALVTPIGRDRSQPEKVTQKILAKMSRTARNQHFHTERALIKEHELDARAPRRITAPRADCSPIQGSQGFVIGSRGQSHQ